MWLWRRWGEKEDDREGMKVGVAEIRMIQKMTEKGRLWI